ncbi:hypothetical protein [Salibacter halophilus]|uniref:Tetratricopeptide repeat protein n=1 Tax=Salibacter halophilus TaxID=1803916 RepID=A0A6N6MAH2_9FLAO|nr:hypothetical protein [Salibacter halophilus]KAB1065989.1 hypothetical protein F3059_00515 [Salibacter halophilus]
MGGEGSIHTMINTLKNNRQLLNRRKGFFDQKRSQKELKGLYSKKLKTPEKPLSDKERKEIRSRLRNEIKRQNRLRVVLLFSVLIVVTVIGYLAFSLLAFQSESNTTVKHHKSEVKIYDESINKGLSSLNRKKPFIAIGHFNNALEVRPNDELAIDKLILSYQMLCEQHEKSCQKAAIIIDSLNKEKM